MAPRLGIATTLCLLVCSSACASPSVKTGVAHEAERVKPATKTLRVRPTKPALVIVFATDSAPYFQVRLRFNRRLPIARYGVAAAASREPVGLVAAGVGIGIVPRLAIDPRDERVSALELGPEVAPRIIALAWHRNRYGQAAAEAFVHQAVLTAESLASRAA